MSLSVLVEDDDEEVDGVEELGVGDAADAQADHHDADQLEEGEG